MRSRPEASVRADRRGASAGRIDLLSEDVAVLVQRAGSPGCVDVSRECETIVLRRASRGHLLAVPEHVSLDPSEDA